MADNITLNSGSGGAVLATDDITSVHYQIIKLAHGALDSATVVSQAAPLPVDIRAENASVTVDNGGTFAVQVDGDALTALQLIDNPVVVDDAAFTPATSSVMMAGFEFDDTTPDSVDEGDAGAARMSANRNIYTQIRDAAGNERGVNVNASNQLTVSVDNTVTVASHAVTNAGTFAVQVDGNALTALQLIDNIVVVEDAAHNSGDSGVMALSVRQASATALSGTAGDYQPLITDGNGRLYATATIDAAIPTGSNTIGSIASIGTSIVPGTGATNLGKAEDAAHSSGDTGVMALAVRTDTLAARAGTNNDYAPLQVSALGALQVNLVPETTNGLTIFRSLDIDETEEDVKTSAGQLYWVHAINRTAAPIYLKFYNATAATVVVGTTTPVLTLTVPGNADSDGAGFTQHIVHGLAFSTAICVAATTGVADNDTGAPGANDCVINLGYK